MCEILFRGKREDNGEWVYGTPIYYPDNLVVMCKAGERNHNVTFETAGQYTGLTDKNGVKVFEGDIVHVYGGESYCCSYECDEVMLVEDITDGVCIFLGNAEFIEVIGNIHDNPELLEVKNSGHQEM